MPSIEKEPIYDVYCISRRQYQRFLNMFFLGCLSGAVGSVDVWCSARRSFQGRGFESHYRQNIYSIYRLVASMSGEVLGGVVKVVGLSLTRGKLSTQDQKLSVCLSISWTFFTEL